MRTLEILGDPSQDEHRDTRTWADSMANMTSRHPIAFDPERFDVGAINKRLARLKAPK